MSKKTKRAKIRHSSLEHGSLEHSSLEHGSLETAPPAKKKQAGKGTWKVMDKASTIAAGVIAHRVSALTWRAATGKKPPTSTRHPDLGKAEAVSWAVLAGVVVELCKVLIRRGTANYWVKSTGHLPPGMKPLKPAESKTAKGGKKKPADPPVEESAGKLRRISSRSRGK